MTPETRGVIDAAALDALADHAWRVTAARGPHIVTDDLVDALRAGRIGGAALDVTDPEPLPDQHPLWSLPNAIITPHVGNTPAMAVPLLGARVTENVRRFAAGDPLIGLVDPDLGY
ncbi:MAG: hydroxyacid dehydrogenase, partial [Actinobacteria bacterium]|nr:hydroxyacid dehydrogenase [Actinomycetota bacterium]